MARIRIVSFGCSSNFAEGEMMSGMLQEQGHNIVNSDEDVAIINLCAVKGPSLNKGIRAAQSSKGKVIFAGCVPKYAVGLLIRSVPNSSIVNTHGLHFISEAVASVLKGKRVQIFIDEKKAKLCFPRNRLNKIIAIIPISSGCMGKCSYCAVKGIKGNLLSYPPETIIREARQSIAEGCRELWITAQDTGCYGLDIGTTLPALLKELVKLDGNFRIRLGMATPHFMARYSDEMIEIFKSEKLFKFLHIPLQSGSDKILKLMNRPYTALQFIETVRKFRNAFSELSLSTDIIVGFPGETEADFKESIEAIRDSRPDILNLNRFWRMPETPAFRMKPLVSQVLKQRSRAMLPVFEKISTERNEKWIGWKGTAIVDEKGKNKSSIARNFAYRPIILKEDLKIGDEVCVKVTKAGKHELFAVIA